MGALVGLLLTCLNLVRFVLVNPFTKRVFRRKCFAWIVSLIGLRLGGQMLGLT